MNATTAPDEASPTSAWGHDEARTRHRVLAAVLAGGPISASRLASELGLTAAAIRRHLDGLHEAGQIDVRSTTEKDGKRGRPARLYVVTNDGHSQLDNAYDEIASDALTFLGEVAGTTAVAEFAARRADRMERKYQPLIDAAGPETTDRAAALASALTEDGYVSSSSTVAAGTSIESVQLCQGHCPVQHVATDFPQLCEAELQAFANLLDVDVRRLSTLASGGHVCTTHIPTTHEGRGHKPAANDARRSKKE
ncbi:helix-turn-helix transcriptional regulator [Spelaeicoccus albus]|uniref:Putative ArsR family transcriptional regulator n=1 Tax=Spelaeicoccus albus TaxID=1280376 RepID=A0A7Z0D432_9MICO|nr:HTH domain-containing protein [Spelaeicoccus albus]NYI68519.1 putative ArsR family transcriptional regulator [Spelaeicoccus albus]